MAYYVHVKWEECIPHLLNWSTLNIAAECWPACIMTLTYIHSEDKLCWQSASMDHLITEFFAESFVAQQYILCAVRLRHGSRVWRKCWQIHLIHYSYLYKRFDKTYYENVFYVTLKRCKWSLWWDIFPSRMCPWIKILIGPVHFWNGPNTRCLWIILK